MDDLEQARRAVDPAVEDKRRGYAKVAVEAYADVAGRAYLLRDFGGIPTDRLTGLLMDLNTDVLTDLVADLWHLADGEGLDFESIIGTARMHHEAERTPLRMTRPVDRSARLVVLRTEAGDEEYWLAPSEDEAVKMVERFKADHDIAMATHEDIHRYEEQ